MATFKALNLESDDESDIEFDNTKEIQIEEALKLYQIALKFHSDGPATYSDAARAYKELFDSEIFHYPESQSELRRVELFGPLPDQDNWIDDQLDDLEEPLLITDNAPSTLPQIIHLAHKNYGDFILADLAERQKARSSSSSELTWPAIRDAAASALDHFVEALDKDDTDLDVWNQTFTVGSTLDSVRVARFCLESILDDDQNAIDDMMAFPSFTETAAGQRLCRLVQDFEDTLSMLQSPLNTMRRKQLSALLRQRIGLHDGDLDVSLLRSMCQAARRQVQASASYHVPIPSPRTWAGFASALAGLSDGEHLGETPAKVGGIVLFADEALAASVDNEDDAMLLDSRTPTLPSITDIDAIYPGLDRGRPTAPVPVFGDLAQYQYIWRHATRRLSLSVRKRSSDAAALEPQDLGRVKSKRLRARESLIEGVPSLDVGLSGPKKVKRDPFEETEASDAWCFRSVDELLAKIGAETFGDLAKHRPQQTYTSDEDSSVKYNFNSSTPAASSDLYTLLVDSAQLIPKIAPVKSSEGSDTSESPHSHLLAALEQDTTTLTRPALKASIHADHGLKNILDHINRTSLSIPEVSFVLLQILLFPGSQRLRPRLPSSQSSYSGHLWTEEMKKSVVTILVTCDDYLLRTCGALLDRISQDAHAGSKVSDSVSTSMLNDLVHMIQSIWEMHLDFFAYLAHSDQDQAITSTAAQRDRVERWADQARDAIELRRNQVKLTTDDVDELGLRYVWAIAAQIKMTDRADQQSILSHLNELREILVELEEPIIHLPNNVLLSVLSLEAIDREIAKITTSDFFNKVFDSGGGDPTAIVEGLEPILEVVRVRRLKTAGIEDGEHAADETQSNGNALALPTTSAASGELIDFLCNCSNTVILALWQKLLLAYQSIDYPPMIAYCQFRMIESAVSDFLSPRHEYGSEDDRYLEILTVAQRVHETLLRVIDMTKVSAPVFEVMDEARLRSLASTLIRWLKTLHYANFAEDEIRVGERSPPFDKDSTKGRPYRQAVKLLNDCQLSCWIVLYMVFEEAATQDPQSFPQAEFDVHRMEMLRSIHTATGLRQFCDGAGRILLNLLKKELPTLQHVAGYDLEFSQVLVDLYGLNCFLNPSWEQLPHDCPGDVSLDRAAAVQAVDLLLLQASKIKANELYKHSLKDAFERVHVVVARKKPSDAILRNREIFAQFFKAPINPLDLYRCLNGEGEINLVPLPDKLASLANKGWYFTMGYLALTKFRSLKRVAAGPTDELDTSISFFSQDLEYGAEKWETWFRLAQAYDSKLEDYVTWNADKLNKNMSEVAQLQRSAIHCYRMATALATRITDPEFESSASVAELYADFATRIYSSSRQPFSMRAFSLQDATRFLSTSTLVKVRPFMPLTERTAWKFAKVLYQRAIAGNPTKWSLHFMLGKCLWKLYMANLREGKTYCNPNMIITAYHRAIELLPRERRDRKDPILEPHYKLVATVHKLMTNGISRPYSAEEACDQMILTPYAAKVKRCEDLEEWDDYVLNVLKQIRNADKSNWHHRMIVRAARIHYGNGTEPRDYASTLGAKHELTQQLFTKTMVLQVWKPEFERSGRHFVYTHQYTVFFVEILEKLGNRSELEQLVRRVRKRTGDYYEFEKLWTWLFGVYLSMLRKQSRVPVGHEMTTFGILELTEFQKRKELLEKFCQDPEVQNPTLDILREAIEFKKVNQGMEKPTIIDDLIGDVYAYLFDTVGKTLWEEQQRKEAPPRPPMMDTFGLSQAQQPQMGALGLTAGATPDMFRPQPRPVDILAHTDGTATDRTVTPNPGETTPVKRKIGIGRRDVRTAAEACTVKAVVEKPAVPEPSNRQVQVVIHRKPVTLDSPAGSSVQDQADNESEDEGSKGSPSPHGVMFPGLAGNSGDDQGADDGNDGDDEGDEGDEDGDMEEQPTEQASTTAPPGFATISAGAKPAASE